MLSKWGLPKLYQEDLGDDIAVGFGTMDEPRDMSLMGGKWQGTDRDDCRLRRQKDINTINKYIYIMSFTQQVGVSSYYAGYFRT